MNNRLTDITTDITLYFLSLQSFCKKVQPGTAFIIVRQTLKSSKNQPDDNFLLDHSKT